MAKKNVVIAGIYGSVLEWYDFSVYAFFAPLFANLFFPQHDPLISLILTFGVFAVGFFVRPFSAIFFGYLGDHVGRKHALIISMALMSVPTFLIAFLPSYAVIGIAAPILLTLLRMIQGLAMGGELTTATSFLVEHAAQNRRGFAGSLSMCSAFAGMALSSAIATLLTNIFEPNMLAAWGWRIAFIVGGLLGIIGVIIRLKTHEPEIYQKIQATKKANVSVLTHLKRLNYKIISIAVLLTSIMAVGNYYLVAYFNTYLLRQEHLPLDKVMLINFFNLCIFAALIPVMGALSDKLGRKTVLRTGIIGMALIAYPVFWLFEQGTLATAFLAQLIFVTVLSAIAGLIPTTLAELFETHNRNTSLSLGYNIALALFGGTAPIVALSLVEWTSNPITPAYYLMGCAFAALITLLFITESYKKEFV
jgi:proline/betaine transport protein TphA